MDRRTLVGNILKAHGIEPAPERESRTAWRTFLAAHWDSIAAADFTTVEVWTRSGLVTFYVLVVMHLKTRRIEIAGATPHPNSEWMQQFGRNLTDCVDGFFRSSTPVILDRDTKHLPVRQILKSSDIEAVVLPPKSPNLNAHLERFMRSLKSECLNRDWRQLEFPATTNGIPRFFRADPDHEGMVKDQQVRRLVKLKKNEKTLTMAAAKAGMSRKTARKYLKSGKLPSQCQPERYWRTRSDPFESVWPEVKEILKRSPTVEAKAVFDHLCRQQEGAFQQGQLRTLQRRIKQWKAEYGEAKEVMFPQKYQPGHQAQSDFTFMGRLGVTIQGQPFPHLLYHFVLAYSNWEATTLCFSESFESLSLGLQNALWELGALPEEHRTDRLSAAVKNLKREEFTERYQALLRHFGMRSSRTQAGKAHENGDVEQSHHRLKRAIEQELLLRCSRDFSSREEYEGFVAVIVSRRNAARQKRLGEELAVMRPLPARRLDDFTRQWVRVSPSSTIRVRHNTYSVDSRLIGERVQVRVWADQVEVYYGGRRQARMPRLRGEGKHRIDYRHVIHSLVRKPGAFTRYRWREDLFPGILFRVAYDELRRDCPATADRQYLKILEVAAQEGEQRVREALQVLIERGQRIRFEALRECLVDPVVEPWEVMVEKMDVGLYDTLLENREVRS